MFSVLFYLILFLDRKLNELQFILFFLTKEKDTIFTHSIFSFSFLRTRRDLLFLPITYQLCRYNHLFIQWIVEGERVRACKCIKQKRISKKTKKQFRTCQYTAYHSHYIKSILYCKYRCPMKPLIPFFLFFCMTFLCRWFIKKDEKFR